MIKKLCVITGTRAEYGLLKPLMDRINKEKVFKLQLIVTGMHLSHEFGFTCSGIEKDGFNIDKKIEILLSSDTPISVSKSMGLGLISYSEAFNELEPDALILLGDRFEVFSAAAAATVCKVPIFHLHGGERTEGAYDESFRHSITKMSHLHFTSTEEYRKRVIQLGESPDRVFNVGAIGLDNINNIQLYSKESLERELQIVFNKRSLLVTFHPETLGNDDSVDNFSNLLEVLDDLNDTTLIFTKANSDNQGRAINQEIDSYVAKNKHKSIAFASMGVRKYLSTMQYVDGVIGNSSSGVIEAPSFKVGTVNIGERQKGRIKAASVIDCNSKKESIKKAIELLFSDKFRAKLSNVVSPYGDGTTALKIIEIIKHYDINNILNKSFYDLDFLNNSLFKTK